MDISDKYQDASKDTHVRVSSNFLTRSPAEPFATDLCKSSFFSSFIFLKKIIAHVYLQEICDSNSITRKPICMKLYQISF